MREKLPNQNQSSLDSLDPPRTPSVSRWSVTAVVASATLRLAKYGTIGAGFLAGATQVEKTGTAPWQLGGAPPSTPLSNAVAYVFPSLAPWVADSARLPLLKVGKDNNLYQPDTAETDEASTREIVLSRTVPPTPQAKLEFGLTEMSEYLRKLGATPPPIKVGNQPETLETLKAFGDSVLTLGPATTGKNEAIYLVWAVKTLSASDESVDLFYRAILDWKVKLEAPPAAPVDTRNYEKLYLTDERIAEYSSGPYNPKPELLPARKKLPPVAAPSSNAYAELQSLAQRATEAPPLQRPDLSQTPASQYLAIRAAAEPLLRANLRSVDEEIVKQGGKVPQKDFVNLKALLGTLSDYRQSITLLDPGSPTIRSLTLQIEGWKKDPKAMFELYRLLPAEK